jgi:hypothetical protein
MHKAQTRHSIFQEAAMARPSKLASMSIDALLKLRDDVGVLLSRRADAL